MRGAGACHERAKSALPRRCWAATVSAPIGWVAGGRGYITRLQNWDSQKVHGHDEYNVAGEGAHCAQCGRQRKPKFHRHLRRTVSTPEKDKHEVTKQMGAGQSFPAFHGLIALTSAGENGFFRRCSVQRVSKVSIALRAKWADFVHAEPPHVVVLYYLRSSRCCGVVLDHRLPFITRECRSSG